MNRAAALDMRDLAGHGAHSTSYGSSLPDAGRAALSVALWVFMLVASALFMLFMAAYMMRMLSPDWSPVGMPWQLWLSSACLLVGSAALHFAGATAGAGALERARLLFVIGGACALAFLLVQGWAWQLLLDMQVRPAGNPAGSFFYLLTAMHGLHVVGGLVCWALAARFAWRTADASGAAWRMRLCARYWHFLLLVWVALFAALNWLSPEFVRAVCGIQA